MPGGGPAAFNQDLEGCREEADGRGPCLCSIGAKGQNDVGRSLSSREAKESTSSVIPHQPGHTGQGQGEPQEVTESAYQKRDVM